MQVLKCLTHLEYSCLRMCACVITAALLQRCRHALQECWHWQSCAQMAIGHEHLRCCQQVQQALLVLCCTLLVRLQHHLCCLLYLWQSYHAFSAASAVPGTWHFPWRRHNYSSKAQLPYL